MALITPEKLAESGSEDGTQKAYIQACRTGLRAVYPELALLYHVPNGGQRGDNLAAAKTMSNMKAMGLVNGVPDICLPVGRLGYKNLYIEFKRPDGKNKLDPEQLVFIRLLAQNDCLVVICDHWQHAYDVTRMYLQQSRDLLMLLNPEPLYGIPPLRCIDVSGYVTKLVKSPVWKRFTVAYPQHA